MIEGRRRRLRLRRRRNGRSGLGRLFAFDRDREHVAAAARLDVALATPALTLRDDDVMAGGDEDVRRRRFVQRRAVDEHARAARLRLEAKTCRPRLDLRDRSGGRRREVAFVPRLGEVSLVGVDGRLRMPELLLCERDVVDDRGRVMLGVGLAKEATRALVVTVLVETNAVGKHLARLRDVSGMRGRGRREAPRGEQDREEPRSAPWSFWA